MNRITTNAGVTMPQLIYGTAWKEDKTAELVKLALQCGFRGFDTACQPKHYQESGVGEAIQHASAQGIRRSELFIQTKFTPVAGQDPSTIPYDPQAPLRDQVHQSFQASLANLQTEYVDSLILHSPISPWDSLLEVWEAMEELVDSGEVRQLGISNCENLELLRLLYITAKRKPAVLQNRLYARTGYDNSLRQFCRKKGMFYQSFWTLSANPHVLSHSALERIAERYNKSVEQIFFCYLTQLGIVPLTGTTSEQHMREALEIFNITLTEADSLSIQKIGPF
jgi:diketogulonate reductase-like aldo/keto reductase